MKTLVLLMFAATAPMALAALPDPVTFHSSKSTVVFQHPDKFTDIKDSNNPTDKGELGFLEEFANNIMQDADQELPNGYHFTITFTDVKYAGQLPLMSVNDETRIIRGTFPPHYKFSYQVTNASGQVVKQGNEDLNDIDFELKMSRADDYGPLRVDKDEMNDWVSQHLRHLGK